MDRFGPVDGVVFLDRVSDAGLQYPTIVFQGKEGI